MAKQPETNQPRPMSPRIEPSEITISIPDLSQPQTRKSGRVAEDAKLRLETITPESDRIQYRANATKPPDWRLPDIDEGLENPVDETVADRIHRNRNPLSSFLISVISHTGLLLVLALIVFRLPSDDPAVSVIAEIESTPAPEASEMEMEQIEIISDQPDESPFDMNATDLSVDTEILAPEEQNSLVQLPNEFINPAEAPNDAPEVSSQLLPTGGGLEGRDAESRSRLAASQGGSKASEEAVERGLQWIINHQQENGGWSFLHTKGQCYGRCKNPGSRESTTAATGLSLLALLGAGYTQEAGIYQSEVQRGLDYLISRIRKNRYGGNLAEGSMYAQGIATLALSEAYIMTRDEKLREPTQLAMQYIISAQHSRGGWRYNPGEPGDMTVTGWQLMALKSCDRAGFEVPREVWNKAKSFIDSKGESGGCYYGYLKPGIEPSPTAIGLLSQMYLGWSRQRGALATGAERLADWGPSKNDVYFNYYATQVLHHLQTDEWKDWNQQLRDYLVKTQDLRGHQAGSWFSPEKHNNVGGRLYTTAMSVMILEVYYRYLPLYDERAVD